MARSGADLGVSLGMKVARIASTVRETSLARTTPGLTAQAIKVADSLASQRARQANDTMLGWLEAHASHSPLPPAIAGLFGALGKLGGWLAQNVYGTAIGFGIGQALSAVLEPYFADMVQDAWAKNPVQVLSPADLALAKLKNTLGDVDPIAEAAKSGIDPARFEVMLGNTGEPPAPAEIAALWRRGDASDEELLRSLRQSRVRDEWLDMVKRMSIQTPSPVEPLEALLEGQISEPEARDWFRRFGGLEEWFDTSFRTRGQAPSPVEALDLANRGLIPWEGRGFDVLSFEQAFLEGPWRNKWLGSFRSLGRYLPPPRTVTALLRAGAIDRARAVELWMMSGLTPEDAAAYAASATREKVGPQKDLTVGIIQDLYRDQAINRDEATGMLDSLGYDAQEADFILLVQDFAREARFREAAVSRIHNLYVAHRLPRDEAGNALASLLVPAEQIAGLLDLWDLERDANVRQLTEAQIAGAVRRGIRSPEWGAQELAQMGYADDAIAVLLELAAPPPPRR